MRSYALCCTGGGLLTMLAASLDMRNKTAKQLVLNLTGMTVGVALMLPDIDLFRAVGLAILVVSGFLSSTEEQAARRIGSVLLVLAICMFLVVLSIYGDDFVASRKGGPRTWYVVALVATWLFCGLWEYRRWSGRGVDDHAA